MASSLPEPTQNKFENVIKMYTDMLDEVYAQNAKTTMWTPNPKLVEGFQNSAEGQIATITTSGLGDYTDAGYSLGKAGSVFHSYTLKYDRSISFPLHKTNLMKSGNIGYGSAVLAEFSRTQLVPEVDACRIARVVQACETDKEARVKEYTPAKKDIVATIKAGLKTIQNDTGIDSGINILFNAYYSDILEDSTEFTRYKDIESSTGAINSRVGAINGNPVMMCPSKRMISKVKTKPGSTPDDTGFVADSGSQEVVALLTAPDTAQGIIAHEITDIFPRSERFDGTLINFHVYHDCIVPVNKIPGCYAILKPVARPPKGPDSA